ncbi:MAG TPA: hypothetical protein VH417_19825 [Vicinamibacterales bacterium]|jgi:hypothetical protein
MRQIFDVMFVLCFFVPPAAVIVGAVGLAWPRHVHKVRTPAAHPAHA